MEEPERFECKATKTGKMLRACALRTGRTLIDPHAKLAIVVAFSFFLFDTPLGQAFIEPWLALVFFAAFFLGTAIDTHGARKRHHWARNGMEEIAGMEGARCYERGNRYHILQSRIFIYAAIDRAYCHQEKVSNLLSRRSKYRMRRPSITRHYQADILKSLDERRERDGVTNGVRFTKQGAWRTN